MNASQKIVGLATIALPCLSFAARTVTTSAELVAALDELKGTGETIVLDGASFDVSAYEMCNNSETLAHLSMSGLTLTGRSDNPRDTVIYGNGKKSIVHMPPFVDSQGRLVATELQNVTISNGCAKAGAYGGGVAGGRWGYFPICRNLIVTGNQNPTGTGGGLAFVTCYDCEVYGNSANLGGGVAQMTRFERGSIHDNTATVYGGGVWDVSLIDTSVWGNTAAGYGGLGANGSYTATNCLIVSNRTTNTSYSCGGVGGVLGGRYVVTDCIIADNESAGAGGGAKTADLTRCVVSNNVAKANGAGANDCLLVDSTVIGNTLRNAIENGTNYGGGIADCTARNCLIAENYSFNCGGGAGNSTLEGCVVSNNFACTQGGGLYLGSAKDSQIVFNVVSNDYTATAGGYWAQGGGARLAILTGCTLAGNAIANCNSSQRLGGAASDSTLVDCRVFNNYAWVGAALNGGSADHCVISNNATSSGIYVIRNTTKLTACDIYGAVMESPGAMLNCVVRGGGLPAVLEDGENAAATGTFAVAETAPVAANVVHATNCLFTANVAQILISGKQYSGKVVPMDLVNCTVAGNRIDSTVAAMRPDGGNGSLTLVNCIFAENRNKDGTASRDFLFQYNSDNNVTMVNCLLPNGLPKDWTPVSVSGLVTGKPRFCGEEDDAHPYALRHSSAARAKGQVANWMLAATDIRENAAYPRLRDGQVDIGCYQCWLNPKGLTFLVR